MTDLDALDYAAAALNDCRRAAGKAENNKLASILSEARDRIIRMSGQQPNAVLVSEELSQTQQAPVFAPTLSH